MDLEVAIHLIAKGIPKTGSTQSWADLGAGSGLFTVALSHLLPLGSMIDAVDRDGSALRKIKIDTQHASLNTIQDDFEKANILKAPLDGIVMANSLHFVADHLTFVKNLRKTLKPSGRLIIVEYDMKSSSHWVPYPVQYNELKILGAKPALSMLQKWERCLLF